MKAENSNHLEVQNPLSAVEIIQHHLETLLRVLAFCRQIHIQYAQKLCISHRVQIPVTKDRNDIFVYVGYGGFWFGFFLVCLFSLFDFVVDDKIVEKMQGKIHCLQITQETYGTYQN